MNTMKTKAGSMAEDAPARMSVLNSFLRGEISAVETYDQAIAKFNDDHVTATTLTAVRDDHLRCVSLLRKHILSHGGEPIEGSSVWGTFAAVVTGTAKVLGPQTVIAALKQGEQHGETEYEAGMKGDDLGGECKTLVSTELLPLTQRHIRTLDVLIESLAAK